MFELFITLSSRTILLIYYQWFSSCLCGLASSSILVVCFGGGGLMELLKSNSGQVNNTDKELEGHLRNRQWKDQNPLEHSTFGTGNKTIEVHLSGQYLEK